ncbi:MAG: hypothetical protein F6K31_38820, partial [Symploca sp. SIO2G7]|nr:hypothetical protein [Symploca sp. SIO2G7]
SAETVLPLEETSFNTIDDLNIIETVTEPETEIQLNRLPETVVEQETISPETPPETTGMETGSPETDLTNIVEESIAPPTDQ